MFLLHILLSVLKIIGFLLLVILTVLLLLLLAVLFVPFRYRVTAAAGGEETRIGASVVWLLHFISLRFSFDLKKGERELSLCILGVDPQAVLHRLHGRKKEPDQGKTDTKQRRKKKTKQKNAEKDAAAPERKAEVRADENPYSENCLPKSEKDAAAPERISEGRPGSCQSSGVNAQSGRQETADSIHSSIHSEEAPVTSEAGNETNTGEEQETDFREHGKEWFRNFLYKIKAFCDKIKHIPERAGKLFQKLIALFSKPGEVLKKLEEIRQMLQTYEAAEVLTGVFARLKKLLRHCRVRKGSGYLHFGVGDPAKTGELTGIIYCILPAGCGEIEVCPEFNDTVFETNLELRGYVRLIHVLITAGCLFFDRKLRNLIGAIRNR